MVDHIRFCAEVVSIEAGDSETWQLQLASGEPLRSKRFALGNNSVPRYLSWQACLSEVDCIHSMDYRNAQGFEGKNVLVVGGGESGSDVALEISRVARQCWVSLRHHTGWVVPRRRGHYAADISTHRGVWGLPRSYGSILSNDIDRAELSQQNPVHDAVVMLNRKIEAEKRVWGTFATKTLALPQAIVHHGCIGVYPL